MILHFRSPKSVSLCWNQNVTRLCYFWRFGNLFLCLFFFLGLWSSSTLKASGIAALDPISTLHLWSYYLLWFWSSGLYLQFSSVVQSCLTLCDPMDWSIPGLPVHHQLLEFIQTLSVESVMASNHLILCHPLLLPLSIFPRIRVFSNEKGGQSFGVSASTSVLPMNIQDSFPLDGLVGSPCSSRDSQQSSLASQFKSIYFSALSLLYGPTLTSIHDYCKSHSFD